MQAESILGEIGGVVLSKGTTWTRVYKNIDVDAMSLANEIARILQSIGFSASIKEKGLIRKSVTVKFSKKGGLFSYVRGELRFSGGSQKIHGGNEFYKHKIRQSRG